MVEFEELVLAVQFLILGLLIWMAYNRNKNMPKLESEPDYVSKFESLAGDALMDAIEKRKATVEDVVLEDLPLHLLNLQPLEQVSLKVKLKK